MYNLNKKRGEDMVSPTTKRLSKADAFKEIAAKRTIRVLDSLRLLGQCSNRRSYEYTDAQVQKIFKEIRNAVRDTENHFKDSKREITFNL